MVDDVPVLAEGVVRQSIDVDATDGERPSSRRDAGELGDVGACVGPSDDDLVVFGDDVLYGEVGCQPPNDHREAVHDSIPSAALAGQGVVLDILLRHKFTDPLGVAVVEQLVELQHNLLVLLGVHEVLRSPWWNSSVGLIGWEGHETLLTELVTDFGAH